MAPKGKKGHGDYNWDEIFEIIDPRTNKSYYIDSQTGKQVKLKEKQAKKHSVKRGLLVENQQYPEAIDLIGPDGEVVKEDLFNKIEKKSIENEYPNANGSHSMQNETSASLKFSKEQFDMNNNNNNNNNNYNDNYNNPPEFHYTNNHSTSSMLEKEEKVAETPSGVLPGSGPTGTNVSSNLVNTNKNPGIYGGIQNSEEAKKSWETISSTNKDIHGDELSNSYNRKKKDDTAFTSTDISYSYTDSYPGNEHKHRREEVPQHLKDDGDEVSRSDSNSKMFTTYSPTPKSMIATRMLPEKSSILELPSPIVTSPQGQIINTVPTNINDLTGVSTDAPDEPIAVASRGQKRLELSMYNDLNNNNGGNGNVNGNQNSVVPRLPIDDYSPLADYQNMIQSNSDSPTSIFKDNGRVSINSITCSANQDGRKSHKNSRQPYQDNNDPNMRGTANVSGRNGSYMTSSVTGSGRLLTVEYSRAKTVLEELQSELKKIEEDNRSLKSKLSAIQHEEELLGGLVYVLRNSTYRWDGSEENIYWD